MALFYSYSCTVSHVIIVINVNYAVFLFSLGAEHDGDLTEKACPPKSNYIMETFIPAADDKASYIVNPYRFSTCSVRAFKRKIRQLE